MTDVDWYKAGQFVGRDLAIQGGTAILENVDGIGTSGAMAWLDGVLDGLRERGVDAKSIVIADAMLEDFPEASRSGEITYRGIVVLAVDDQGTRPSIVVAC